MVQDRRLDRPERTHGSPLVLRAAQLFDGARAIEGATVVVDGSRVAAVERRPMEPPLDAHVLDFGDATLLPGLVDTHVHLGFDASTDPVGQMAGDDDAALLLRMHLAARRSLAAGVTTVRDLGDRGYLSLALRDWFRRGNEIGPEIVASGPPLTVTGGHCHFMGGQADDEGELRRGVRERATRGVDVIKVMVTGGNMTAGISPLTPQYTVAELAAVVDEAHRFGRPVTAHVHGVAGIERAVAAGVDGLEHCGFWVEDGVRADQSLIERIAEQQIAVCPTAGVAPSSYPPPPPVASRLPAMMAAAGQMHRAGVRLLAGTDAGVAPVKPHGMTAYAVCELADKCGMSAVEALQSATSWAAEACGLAGRKGAVAAGADADILVAGGDALADLRALHDVRAVFRAGALVPAEATPQGLVPTSPPAALMAAPNREMDRSTISSLAVNEIRK
ncbi:MAG: amidohydrolase family protein [Actinomycetota bacterium]|nr:amidohydrolase family protein [Actinomycetota bacterium]